MTRQLSSLWRHRGGLAALEFALVAPLLSVLFIGSLDAAQVYIASLRLSASVYAGANYAIANQAGATSSGGGALAATIATIVGNMNGTGWASGTVVVNNGPTVTFRGGQNTSSGSATNADSYYCLSGGPGAWLWGTAQGSASASCGSGGATAGKFVTISASYAITPVILGLGFANGKLSQTVAVQVQ